MSTIFANNLKNISGGNNVKVNQLSGIDTAGSILVTAEGNNTTTNLQSGINKQWVNYNMNTAAIRNSFNTTSITDNTTGDFSVTIANNMANVNYVTAVDGNYNLANGNYTAGSANGLEIYRQMTTTAYDHIAVSSGSTFDFKWVLSCNLGELA